MWFCAAVTKPYWKCRMTADKISGLPPEQRQEYRLDTELTIFIELPTQHMGAKVDIVVSKSLDVSANGLRVITDREIAGGSILRACVQQQAKKSSPVQFVLITEVMWAEPYGNSGEYLVGLSLFESEGSDILAWKEFIADCCGSE